MVDGLRQIDGAETGFLGSKPADVNQAGWNHETIPDPSKEKSLPVFAGTDMIAKIFGDSNSYIPLDSVPDGEIRRGLQVQAEAIKKENAVAAEWVTGGPKGVRGHWSLVEFNPNEKRQS